MSMIRLHRGIDLQRGARGVHPGAHRCCNGTPATATS
jgi:hypothetical protein